MLQCHSNFPDVSEGISRVKKGFNKVRANSENLLLPNPRPYLDDGQKREPFETTINRLAFCLYALNPQRCTNGSRIVPRESPLVNMVIFFATFANDNADDQPFGPFGPAARSRVSNPPLSNDDDQRSSAKLLQSTGTKSA